MEIHALEILENMLLVANIPSVILRKDGSNLSDIDGGFRLRIYENCSYDPVMNFCRLHLKPGTIMWNSDKYQFIYFLLHVPESYINLEQTSYLFIGPILEKRPSPEEIRNIMENCHIPQNFFSDISAFYGTVPVVENTETFECALQNLADVLFQRKYHTVIFPEYDMVFDSFSIPAKEPTEYIRENSPMGADSIKKRYDLESKMLQAVSAGDYSKAHICYQQLSNFYVSPRTSDPVQNARNFLIVLNTLLRKASEAGGVHPFYIDDLSTKFALAINQTVHHPDLKALAGNMIHKYCLLVKNHAMKGYSPVTEQIVSYIDFHYMEDLNLTFFSEMFHMTKTYLSSLFKKETGFTLTDYIHHIRMRKAITLINSTSMSIGEIASACGYNDNNYFFRIFKRTYGISPKQYQKSISHI